MKATFFDVSETWHQLLPLTFTRPCSELRVGILTLREKWNQRLGITTWNYQTQDYLAEKFPFAPSDLWINGAAICTNALAESVKALKDNQAIVCNGQCIAARCSDPAFRFTHLDGLSIQILEDVTVIERPWMIFQQTAAEIRNDFDHITLERTSAPVDDPHTIVYSPENLFIEEGVEIRASIIDATNGPVYLGKNSILSHGVIIRGALALGENSIISMGAKMRGDNAIGPNCKIGGEISNTSFQSNSNKSHDGFLGNSVIGEWCNLGADTNSSNLKNNYSTIKTWNYKEKAYTETGLSFCGLTMGDHSKCAINTMFNTGTVVGVSANVFGAGFPEKFIPSFSWGGSSHWQTYSLEKALETASRVIARRNLNMGVTDRELLKAVYNLSKQYRSWEKNDVYEV